MRQGVRVLRGAIYKRTRAEPVKRVDFEGSAPTGGARIFRSAVAGTNGKFVRRSIRAQDAVFRVAAECCGRGGDAAGKVFHFAPPGTYRRQPGSGRITTEEFP